MQLLREEIDPKLEKLRAEKRSYLEYQKATSELERLTRLVKAYEWTLAVDKASKAATHLKQKKDAIEEAKSDVSRGGREVDGMEKEIADLHRKREKVSDRELWIMNGAHVQEMAKGGKIQALTDAVNALERELVKTKTQVEIFEGTVKDEAGRVEAAKKGVTDVSLVPQLLLPY